jgi:hypothetical protein
MANYEVRDTDGAVVVTIGNVKAMVLEGATGYMKFMPEQGEAVVVGSAKNYTAFFLSPHGILGVGKLPEEKTGD